MRKKMYICAGDISSGDYKMAMGRSSDKKISNLSIQTLNLTPESMLPDTMYNYKNINERALVKINGKNFVIGGKPDPVNEIERELHQEYIDHNQYYGWFRLTLAQQTEDQIDAYVVGLPLRYALSSENREFLHNRLTGSHQVSKDRVIIVKKILVFPQSYGAYHSFIKDNNTYKDLFEEGNILVIDVGRFTVDFLLMSQGKIQKESSYTSDEGTEKIFSTVQENIFDEKDICISISEIEATTVSNNDFVSTKEGKIKISPYLSQASKKVSSKALSDLKEKISNNNNSDAILLTGSGSFFYREETKRIFNDCENILIPNHSVFSNAKGFWYAVGALDLIDK